MSKTNLVLISKFLIEHISRAVSKIRSYDDFVPYYHQFIEQMANLLGNFLQFKEETTNISLFSEVSKGDEIMPAIKTLKLLAHGENYSSTNELKARRNSLEKTKSAHGSLSQLNEKNDSEQAQTVTDEGDS